MKKLKLVLKHKYFNEILAGIKKEEAREIRPNNQKKYLDFDEKGEFKDIRKYDVLVLYAGYEKNRPMLEVEVIGSLLEFLDDEDGNPATFEHEGETYDYTNIVYELGNILHKENC